MHVHKHTNKPQHMQILLHVKFIHGKIFIPSIIKLYKIVFIILMFTVESDTDRHM